MADEPVNEKTAEPGSEKWERWQKRRIFVREVAGKYGEIYRQLLEQPRVYKTKGKPWKGGPTLFERAIINPQHAMVTQSIETHICVIAPGSKGQKHGHINSAVFYILEGKGYDVHDGERIDWQAGDVCIVENGCVHQHLNADPNHPAKFVIFKAKPLFLFLHLLFQRTVEYPPTQGEPGWEDFKPED